MAKQWLTAAQVEEMTGIKEKTLANWRSQGRGPQYHKVGKIIRYALEEIERWMQSFRVRTIDSTVLQ